MARPAPPRPGAGTGGARSRRRPGWQLVLPLSLAALDDADHVAEALRARGGTLK